MAIVFEDIFRPRNMPMRHSWDEDTDKKKFYRYVDRYGQHIDEQVYYLVKETPCGWWIRHSWDYREEYKKWIKKKAYRKFACETKEEALESFKARKNRQIWILERQLQDAKRALRFAINKENIHNREFEDFIEKDEMDLTETVHLTKKAS